jgi:hypothetical protein
MSVLAALALCASCCPYGGWQKPDPIPFGSGADFEAVTTMGPCDALECWLAVGSGGTIAWAYGHLPGEVIEYEAWSTEIGDVDLTGVFVNEEGWWVVGEAGTVAVSEDQGGAWESSDLETTADLYGMTQHIEQLVVVGDEVVVVRQPDGIWIETPAPAGGWGELRGVYSDGVRVYAVGSAGRAWSAADPVGQWVVEELGVEVDLADVGWHRGVHGRPDQVAIAGDRGTLMIGDHDTGWSRLDTGTTVDLIDVSNSRLLTADGEVFDFLHGELDKIDSTFAGAKALHNAGLDIAVVGDGGRAQRLHKIMCAG